MNIKSLIQKKLQKTWAEWFKLDKEVANPYDQGRVDGKLATLLSLENFLEEITRKVKNGPR